MQAKLNIYWVTPHLRGRGVTVVVEEATHAVAKLTSAQVSICCLHNLPDSYFESSIVPAVCLNLPRDDRQVAIDGFRSWMEQELPDVLIMNDVASIEAFWPYIPRQIRVIVVLHDHAYGWTKSAIEYAESLDAIIPVSKFVERSVSAKMRHFSGIFRTVENGTSYPPSLKREVSTGPLKLVFLGAIDRQKGAFDLPKILAECEKRNIYYSLTIIGGTSEALAAEFARSGVSHNVVWVGHMPRHRCFEFLANSDILLMLSRGESFGLVTIEAMSMGCVPIGYAVGGTSSIIDDGETGFLVPLCSYNVFGEVLELVDKDRRRLLELSKEAIIRVRLRYSSRAMAVRYLKLIQDVIASPRESVRFEVDMFRLKNPTSRRYVKLFPAVFRRMISKVISINPHLENRLRKWRGI
jgi:glycosyltransferase involved in cell wall biosynthesis